MLLDKFKQATKSFGITHKNKVLCAVSAGRDSMAMLDLCLKLSLNIGVAHVNYGLRGENSDLDEKLVSDFCLANGIPFHVKRAHKPKASTNTQLWAREERFALFSELMDQEKYEYTLIAHHQSDQVETILMGIFKGYDLHTIKAVNQRYLRPMLSFTQEEIINHVQQNKILFRTDESNLSNVYDRNFIRNELIPAISERFPNFNNRLLGFAERQNKKNELLHQLILEQIDPYINWESTDRSENAYQSIDLKLLKIRHGYALLESYLSGFYAFSLDQIEKIILTENSASIFESEIHAIVKRKNHLYLGLKTTSNAEAILIQKQQIPFLGPHKLVLSKAKPSEIRDIRLIIGADADKLKYPLEVLFGCKDAQIKPLGMRGKSKKLSKYLKEKGLNYFELRDKILIKDAKSQWIIPNIGIDEDLKVDQGTKNLLIVQIGDKSE